MEKGLLFIQLRILGFPLFFHFTRLSKICHLQHLTFESICISLDCLELKWQCLKWTWLKQKMKFIQSILVYFIEWQSCEKHHKAVRPHKYRTSTAFYLCFSLYVIILHSCSRYILHCGEYGQQPSHLAFLGPNIQGKALIGPICSAHFRSLSVARMTGSFLIIFYHHNNNRPIAVHDRDTLPRIPGLLDRQNKYHFELNFFLPFPNFSDF